MEISEDHFNSEFDEIQRAYQRRDRRFLILKLNSNAENPRTGGTLRSLAARNLGALKDPIAVPALLEALARDADLITRAAAAAALGEIGDPRAVGGLIAATRDPAPVVRLRAAKMLGALGDSRATSALVDLLADHRHDIRRCAAKALAAVGDDTAVATLRAAERRESWRTRFVYRRARRAIRRRPK